MNLTKTKFMRFHPKQKDISSLVPKHVIDNIPIENVDNYSFLGVCLDSKLKWDGHMQFLATKPESIQEPWIKTLFASWHITDPM